MNVNDKARENQIPENLIVHYGFPTSTDLKFWIGKNF